MPGFTQIFGGSTIAPANATFLRLDMDASVQLQWPIEQAISGNLVVADTIEVVATLPGLNIDMPDARQVSKGYTTLFNNTGAQTVSVRDVLGNNLLSLVSGSAWVLYLADNSTEAGVWRIFQLGASVSVAVAAALAGAGLKAIGSVLAQDMAMTSTAASPLNILNGDRAECFNWTGGVGTFNLPAAGTVGNGWFVAIRNSGSGDLTVTPPAGSIDGAANKTFASGTSSFVVTDGVNYFTIGFGSGSGAGAGFDFVELNVAGSGNFVLAGANLNRIAYRFVGVLTGNRTIIVPGAIQQYWVANATTGAFSLFVKTLAQVAPGIEVLQNNQAIMYCDGNNVIDAESSSVSFPIPVAQGGTGAVNAATARTNLGAGATGSNLFTAATPGDAITALGILALANIWTAIQTVSANDPAWELNEADAAANNRLWSWRVVGEQLQIGVWNDARGAFVPFMAVDRTLNVIDIVNFTTALLQYNGVEVGFRGLPQTTQKTGSYVLVADDRGRSIEFVGGGVGNTFTIPNNILPTDSIVTIKNTSLGTLALSPTGTLRWLSGSGSAPLTGIRSLARGGVATIHFTSGTTYDLIGGIGVS